MRGPPRWGRHATGCSKLQVNRHRVEDMTMPRFAVDAQKGVLWMRRDCTGLDSPGERRCGSARAPHSGPLRRCSPEWPGRRRSAVSPSDTVEAASSPQALQWTAKKSYWLQYTLLQEPYARA